VDETASSATRLSTWDGVIGRKTHSRSPEDATCRQQSLVGTFATLTVTGWRTGAETRHGKRQARLARSFHLQWYRALAHSERSLWPAQLFEGQNR